jgi:SAM-dependent methyltransferase
VTFADAKQRFSTRAADYVRYRPGYPGKIVEILCLDCGLVSGNVVADIGSGTGLLAEIFLKNGNRVFGIEPNLEMRAAGEEYLSRYPQFVSVEGSAEATTLAEKSVDIITAGQAFHWFEPHGTRREFARILKPNGWCAAIWNLRRVAGSEFGREYETLLARYCTDYARVKEAYPETQDMEKFFGPGNFRAREVPNRQEFDFEGLRGRLRSSSYAPREDNANFVPMMKELRIMFERYQRDGRVRMEYSTRIFVGQLHGAIR